MPDHVIDQGKPEPDGWREYVRTLNPELRDEPVKEPLRANDELAEAHRIAATHFGYGSNPTAAAQQPPALPSAFASTAPDPGSPSPPGKQLSVKQQDEVLALLISGRSPGYIQRAFLHRYNLLMTDDVIQYYRSTDPWATVIAEGRKLRYSAVKHEGLALAEERLILLNELADTIRERIEAITLDPTAPAPLNLIKQLQSLMADISEEVGHRRKGLDINNDLVVSIVRGPDKSDSVEAWQAQVQSMELQEQADGTFSEVPPQALQPSHPAS